MVGTNILLSKLSRNRVVYSQSIISLSPFQHSVRGTVNCASWISTHKTHPLLINYFSGTQFLPVKSPCTSALKWNTEFSNIHFPYLRRNILYTSRLFGAKTNKQTKQQQLKSYFFQMHFLSLIFFYFQVCKIYLHALFPIPIHIRTRLGIDRQYNKRARKRHVCQISGPSMR